MHRNKDEGLTTLRVGMKVVCVNARQSPMYADGPMLLEKGAVYTIRDVHLDMSGYAAVRLVEHKHCATYYQGGAEAGYRPSRFRPLVTKTLEQDMETFHPLLSIANSAVGLAAQEGGEVPASTIVERIDYHGMMLDLAWEMYGVAE